MWNWTVNGVVMWTGGDDWSLCRDIGWCGPRFTSTVDELLKMMSEGDMTIWEEKLTHGRNNKSIFSQICCSLISLQDQLLRKLARARTHAQELEFKKAEGEVGGRFCVINPKSVLSTSKPVFLYCSIFPHLPYLSIFLSCCLSEVQLPYQKG